MQRLNVIPLYFKSKFQKLITKTLILCGLLLSIAAYTQSTNTSLPQFVEIKANLLLIQTDVRYSGYNNFVGRPIPGYNSERILLSKPAADSLHKAIKYLNSLGYGVIIYDAYRPQKAVDYFGKWSRDKGDTLMKADYYPDIAKKDLFRLGYITSKSGHSRGSTVDLSLTDLNTGREIDMGGEYDFFDESASPSTDMISAKQQENRYILREAMIRYGFKPLHTEWWHFTLKNEPYPDTYFDVNVE